MLHQTHQVFHQIKFFNPNSDSCVNTTDVDNDTLDEILDTLDVFDDILDAFDENNDAFDEFFLSLIPQIFNKFFLKSIKYFMSNYLLYLSNMHLK